MFRRGLNAFLFQVPVYQSARSLVAALRINSVLDVGCGNPQKLKAYLYPFMEDIFGIDLPDVINMINEPFGTWVECDFNKSEIDLERSFGMIIAADVIEHIEDPTKMLNTIKTHADDDTIIIISTPEKVGDVPKNESHVKEYTREEAAELLEKNSLHVEYNKPYIEVRAIPQYINNMFICKKVDKADGVLNKI